MKSPFLNAVAENMRVKFYAEKSIKAYSYWIIFYIYFNNKSTPLNAMIMKLSPSFYILPTQKSSPTFLF